MAWDSGLVLPPNILGLAGWRKNPHWWEHEVSENKTQQKKTTPITLICFIFPSSHSFSFSLSLFLFLILIFVLEISQELPWQPGKVTVQGRSALGSWNLLYQQDSLYQLDLGLAKAVQPFTNKRGSLFKEPIRIPPFPAEVCCSRRCQKSREVNSK